MSKGVLQSLKKVLLALRFSNRFNLLKSLVKLLISVLLYGVSLPESLISSRLSHIALSSSVHHLNLSLITFFFSGARESRQPWRSCKAS